MNTSPYNCASTPNESNLLRSLFTRQQVSDLVQDYMDFVGDRLTIHQLYGSPAYDITIETDDPQVIEDRNLMNISKCIFECILPIHCKMSN